MSKFIRRNARRLGVATAVGALTLATVGTQVASGDIAGDFAGGADADLVDANVAQSPPGCGDDELDIGGLTAPPVDCDLSAARVEVGDSEAAATGTNILSIESINEGGLSTLGHASNLDPEVLDEELIDEDLLIESNAFKPGGPTADADEVLNITNELVEIAVALTEGLALGTGPGNTTCPDFNNGRATIAQGRNDTVGLAVLPGSLSEVEGAETGSDALLSVKDENMVSYAESRVELVDALVGEVGDNAHGVETTATVELAPVDVAGVEIDVLNPVLTGRHDGENFSFDYQAPILVIDGEEIIDADDLEFLEDLSIGGDETGDDGLTLDISVADADQVQVSGNEAVLTDVVKITVQLGSGTDALEVATVSVGDLSVLADTPEGGVIVSGCDEVAVQPADAERAPDGAGGDGLPRTGGGALAIVGLGVLLATAGALRRRS